MTRDRQGSYCNGMRRPSPSYSPSTLLGDVLIALNKAGIRGLYNYDDNAAMEAARALLEAVGVVPLDPEE